MNRIPLHASGEKGHFKTLIKKHEPIRKSESDPNHFKKRKTSRTTKVERRINHRKKEHQRELAFVLIKPKLYKKCCQILLYYIVFVSLHSCILKEPKKQSLDLEKTPITIELFGENFISTPFYERDIAITSAGDEIIYTLGDYKQNLRCLVSIKKIDGNWSTPEILNISGKYQDIEPFFAPNLDRLYFASNRPIIEGSNRKDYNIWYCDRKNGTWSIPIALDSIINTKDDEFYPSLTKSGTLYFTATREEGIGREDIFKSTVVDGKFQKPTPLDSTINSSAYEFNAYIHPNENLIIFSSFGREDDLGGGDLYFSIKDRNGNWKKAKNMGKEVNSEKLDFCPFVDLQRNNLYFTSERIQTKTIKSDLKTIDELKDRANSSNNGFGNIYRISLDELEKI